MKERVEYTAASKAMAILCSFVSVSLAWGDSIAVAWHNVVHNNNVPVQGNGLAERDLAIAKFTGKDLLIVRYGHGGVLTTTPARFKHAWDGGMSFIVTGAGDGKDRVLDILNTDKSLVQIEILPEVKPTELGMAVNAVPQNFQELVEKAINVMASKAEADFVETQLKPIVEEAAVKIEEVLKQS